MKRSGAIGVVVAVLAVAALLMYFVVMPQMKGSKTVEDIAKKAGDTVEQAKNAVNDAGKQVEDVAKGTEEAKAAFVSKMARLKADTEAATGELQTLLDKGTPTAEAMAAAKAKIEAALKEASDVKLPEGVDAATVALAGKASESAKAALATLEKLPADPAAAKAAIADLKANIESALPGDTAKPADAAKDSTETAKLTPDTTNADGAKQETNPAVPSFDILRVEKDGSTLIAGRAEAGAKVDIVDGDKLIASTQADDTGAFVAVLDNPLASGDHSIVLKTTSKDGKSNASQEIATVSVPKDGKGELLAMVTKPGEASKILTMPEADKTTEVAANKGVTTEPAKATDGTVATPDLPALSTEIAQNPPVVATEDKAKSEAQEVAKADNATPVESAAKTAEPAAAPEVLVSAVEFEGDKIFIAGNTRAGATVRVYADDKIVAEVEANENGGFVADARMPLAVGNHTIRADVLSKDGAKVEFRASVPFFRPEGDLAVVASKEPAKDAATAVEPNANDALDTARDEAGKALGLLKDLYADGKTPTAEELAAARSSTEIALKRLSEVRVAENADAALAEMAKTVSQQAEKALTTLKALPQDPSAVKSALGSIEQGVSSALKPATELAANITIKEPVAAKPADVTASKDTTSAPEDGSVASDAAQPGEVNDLKKKDTLTASEAAKDDATKDKSADTATTAVSNTADGSASSTGTEDVAGKPAPDATQEVATGDQPKVIEQAPLTQSDASSVIIRRGDTLWQISRRVYGKGVRYTTIYVANQAQITDPDRIMPGQVFSMPGKWLDNAEELHKERLHKK
ncbi:LysM peptidoglycan-binding domain-containing protein [Rhizobium sp. LjRoot254]|uniref:LysM peptidoglycan-binding domain-containing protein n=1 Tax=Rhizobium sp. LjRoot254 TaxID=3342297 RepID=UPI003ECC83F6